KIVDVIGGDNLRLDFNKFTIIVGAFHVIRPSETRAIMMRKGESRTRIRTSAVKLVTRALLHGAILQINMEIITAVKSENGVPSVGVADIGIRLPSPHEDTNVSQTIRRLVSFPKSVLELELLKVPSEEPDVSNNSGNVSNFLCQLLLTIFDVAEHRVLPNLELLFYFFKFAGEFKHFGSLNFDIPPTLDERVQLIIFQPSKLESEGRIFNMPELLFYLKFQRNPFDFQFAFINKHLLKLSRVGDEIAGWSIWGQNDRNPFDFQLAFINKHLLKLGRVGDEIAGKGGGVIQGTASEAVLVALLAARDKALKADGIKSLEKLVVYASDQTHSALQKACMIAGICKSNFRVLPTNASTNYALSPDVVQKAILDDIYAGFHPLFLCATVGTTSSTAVDSLKELGKISLDHGMWFHVDAAYAGSACICPEYQHYLDGVEAADSFNMNAHKWLLTNFDCSALWVKDSNALVEALSTQPEFLRNK
ncbi:hypothetical protein KI387_026155, partial [Taxus chinensis]